MTETDTATVLVVDDEVMFLDLYFDHLSENYDGRTASRGSDALDQIDGAVDVLLVDRRMSSLMGTSRSLKYANGDTNSPSRWSAPSNPTATSWTGRSTGI